VCASACLKTWAERSLDLLPLYDPYDDKSSAYAPGRAGRSHVPGAPRRWAKGRVVFRARC